MIEITTTTPRLQDCLDFFFTHTRLRFAEILFYYESKAFGTQFKINTYIFKRLYNR